MSPLLLCCLLLLTSTCGGQTLGNVLEFLLSGGPRPSSSPGSAVRSAANLLCSIVETSSSINPCTTTTTTRPDQGTEDDCRFPFTFRGVTYSSCADWTFGGQPAGTRWCSTRVDRRGGHVRGQYKFCRSPPPTSCPPPPGVSPPEGCRSPPPTSCPPPPGVSPPEGCSRRLVQEQGGEIECQEDDDCPFR